MMSRACASGSVVYRLWMAALALGCFGVLVTAWFLKPAPSGVGTHQQLHMPGCGMYERTGYPCPTCGMTTAFVYMAHGHVIKSFITQPAGALAALACAVLAFAAIYGALTGRRYDRVMTMFDLYWLRFVLLITSVVLLSWAWTCIRIKILNS